MDYSTMTAQEAAKHAFGSNAFPEEFIERFEVKKKSTSDVVEARKYRAEMKAQGFSLYTRTYSDFISVSAAKIRQA